MHHERHNTEHEYQEIERKLDQILRDLSPRLHSVKIAFTLTHTHRRSSHMPVQGPVTLTSAGQVTTASLLGFDQFGNPMPSTFVMPPVTFAIDSPSVATSAPNADGVTDAVVAVANGVANLTASVTSAEGLALSDTETVTVAIPTAVPVLSSVKLAFA